VGSAASIKKFESGSKHVSDKLVTSCAASFVLGPDHLEVAITPFKVIQRQQFWYQSKVHMPLPISD